MPVRPSWPWAAAALGGAALAGAYAYAGTGGSLHPAYAALVCMSGLWAGALVGGTIDWLRMRRSPLAPIFPGRFRWYYRQGLWLRLAAIFALGWLVSAGLAGVFILFMGGPEEVSALLSPGGFLAIGLMAVVYAVIGAVIGGLVSLAGIIFGGGRSDGDAGEKDL